MDTGDYHDYYLELGNANKAYVAVGATERQYPGPTISLNAWHSYVFVKTGTGDSGTLYIDGTALTSYTGSNGSTATLANAGWILGKFRNAGYEYNGLIDDFAIWNRSLSAAEVSSLYSSTSELGAVPEPATGGLALLGLTAAGLVRRRRQG